jgi:hypothetical protein
MEKLTALAQEYHVFVRSDGAGFMRQARILQSMWREEMGYAMGKHRGRLLGSRLPMPWAQETLANYLTDTIRQVVRNELDPEKSVGKVFQTPRIYDNLLSSQPLCFNLFAELQQDLELATRVMQELASGRIGRVTGIAFEHSPGRGDPRYTDDKSAFDAYVAFETPRGGKGFAGVETKYSETLGGSAAPHRQRYDEVANVMGCFKPERRRDLRTQPLQQIWRDHLLAGSLRAAGDYADGCFVFLYPAGNVPCHNAQRAYRDCLLDHDTFLAWTLEDVSATIQRHTQSAWIDRFVDRYLNFEKLKEVHHRPR